MSHFELSRIDSHNDRALPPTSGPGGSPFPAGPLPPSRILEEFRAAVAELLSHATDAADAFTLKMMRTWLADLELALALPCRHDRKNRHDR